MTDPIRSELLALRGHVEIQLHLNGVIRVGHIVHALETNQGHVQYKRGKPFQS